MADGFRSGTSARRVWAKPISGVALLLVAMLSVGAAQASSGRTKQAHARPKLTAALARALARHVDQKVIVILRAQPTGARGGRRAQAARTADLKRLQAPFIAQLRSTHARNVVSYTLVDGFAATVSKAEKFRLQSNPAVAEVVPDVTLQLGTPQVTPTLVKLHTGGRRAHTATSTGTGTGTTLTPNTIPGACSATTPQLDPEGLSLTGTDSTTPGAATARSLGITGAGVKVAYIADGIDPNNINFIRANGSSAFSDTENFTGDAPGTPTTGGEAFLDANTIAGQGLHTYDVNGFSAQPDATACLIRIEGVAPGASLVGLNVFGTNEDTTESNFLQAIQYAVEVDHVNVLNESFGSNNFPDLTALDVTKQFNDAAVAAGTFVSVSSGDAGPFNTIGSPATDPKVVSVGGSTDFRFYAQTNYAAADYFATTGWLSDNISSLSSSGFSETGPTVDMVAPGDLSFASCDPSPLYTDCTDFQNQPSDLEESGGTSESSPFVAGAAALVIQAYRQTHGGATPSPALIKQILLSTATDLGAPGQEQGAGLLNSYKAVELAESIHTANGAPAPVGSTLLTSTNQLNAVGEPGQPESWQVSVTNTGAQTQNVSLYGRTYGPDQNVQSGAVTLDDNTSPQFQNYSGVTNNYATFKFTVPAGANRLTGSIAWPGIAADGNNNRVRLILIDPKGRLAAHSLPQGPGSFGNAEVESPTPGTWEGVIFGDVASVGGTNGTVQWQVATQSLVPSGHVYPNSLTLAPGQTQSVTVSTSLPAAAGDTAGSLVLDSQQGGVTTIPVTLRTLIDAANYGTFSGVLTDGNGRPAGEGQQQYYEFDVNPGVHSIVADVSLTNDAGDPVGAYLVAPGGDIAGYGQNSTSGTQTLSLDAYALNPVPGRWTLIVDFAENNVGDEISQRYTGSIRFDSTPAVAPGLPNSPSERLAAGRSVTVPVRFANTGRAPEEYFIDARLRQSAKLTLAPFDQASGLALPLTGAPPEWFVPTETSSVSVASTATVPIEFDFEPTTGDPDLVSSTGTTAVARYVPANGEQVTNGIWFANPTEFGPYPNGAAAGTVSSAMQVIAAAFDPAVTSTTGDAELSALDPTATFTPVIVNPGQVATIDVTITPSGRPGTVVSGQLFLDDFTSAVPPYGQQAADEVAAIPYTYTIR